MCVRGGPFRRGDRVLGGKEEDGCKNAFWDSAGLFTDFRWGSGACVIVLRLGDVDE